MLTDRERATVAKLGEVWGDICAVVEDGPTRGHDLSELVAHLHALQHAVMSNAAGRAFPDEFRRLGSTLAPTSEGGRDE
jgi:hypothetical protein